MTLKSTTNFQISKKKYWFDDSLFIYLYIVTISHEIVAFSYEFFFKYTIASTIA